MTPKLGCNVLLYLAIGFEISSSLRLQIPEQYRLLRSVSCEARTSPLPAL